MCPVQLVVALHCHIASVAGRKGNVVVEWEKHACIVAIVEDVAGHQNVEGLFVLIPNQYDATIEVAHPILGKVVFCFNPCNQMVNILLTLVFNSKVVDNEGEGDGARCVFPEARCTLAFVITVWGETLSKELVGKDTSLKQHPDGFSHLEVDVASNDLLLEVVLGDDPRRK